MSDIQDEAYSEAMEIILRLKQLSERLKEQLSAAIDEGARIRQEGDSAKEELCKEIKRLKEELELQTTWKDLAHGEIARLNDFQRECLSRGLRIADLERLLTRASDALEDTLPMKQYASQFKLPYYDLIAELRKAVE